MAEQIMTYLLLAAVLAVAIIYYVANANRNRELAAKLAEIPESKIAAVKPPRIMSSGLAVDAGRRAVILINNGSDHTFRTYQAHELLSCELVVDNEVITRTSRPSQLAGAAVGGLIFGKTGAVVGGLTGKKRSRNKARSIKLLLMLDDPDNPTDEVVFDSVAEGQRFHSLVTGIMRKAQIARSTSSVPEKAAEHASVKPAEVTPSDVLRQLKELGSLHSSGTITDAEFEEAKAAILKKI